MQKKVETILLVLTLSLDAFVASLAYGSKKIKIPFMSIIIINIVCSFLLTISIFGGSIIKKILPGNTAIMISFTILMLLGIYYLFEGIIKAYLEKKLDKTRKIKLKLFDIWFIVDIYVDETKADCNHSNDLDYKEAVYLAVALSLDSLAVGFGSALGNINYINIIILSLIVGIFSIWTGLLIGEKIAKKSKANLSWLTGIILIILASLKLF